MLKGLMYVICPDLQLKYLITIVKFFKKALHKQHHMLSLRAKGDAVE